MTSTLNSVHPVTKYLTFAYWIYLVPQYRPENILMLGYSGGTTAGLIRMLYGEVPITAVDIEPCENEHGVNLIQADANEYVKTCGQYDCVIVDIFVEGREPEFIFSEEFVENLYRIANYVIVNIRGSMRLWKYDIFEQVRIIPVGNNNIHYFKNKDAPLDLLPFPPSKDGTIQI